MFRILAFVVSSTLFTFVAILLAGVPMGVFMLQRDAISIAAVALLGLGIAVTNVIAWLMVFALPLRKHGQNVGMKLFGCKVVSSNGDPLTWPIIMKRELIPAILNECGLGLLGYLGVFIGTSERTFYDRLSHTEVVRTTARIPFVNDFRRHIEQEDAWRGTADNDSQEESEPGVARYGSQARRP